MENVGKFGADQHLRDAKGSGNRPVRHPLAELSTRMEAGNRRAFGLRTSKIVTTERTPIRLRWFINLP